jgi:membrane-associated protease RseP (regulator of RpoE activity)
MGLTMLITSVWHMLAFYALFTVLASWVSTCVHELGHALAVRLCGARVEKIRIGIGRSVGFRLFGVDCRLGLNSTAGYCHYEDVPGSDRGFLYRSIVIFLAGPLAEALVCGLTLWVAITYLRFEEAFAYLGGLIVMSAFGCVVNLLPLPERDGYYILSSVRELLRTPQTKEAAV